MVMRRGATAPHASQGGDARHSLAFLPLGAGGLFLCLTLCLSGCHPPPAAAPPASPPVVGDILAPGVVHRAIPMSNGTGIDVIDVDLTRAHVTLGIATEGVGRTNGMIGGRAWTPREWLDKRHALAAANGGYFGRDDGAGRREFVGLLVQGGKVRHAAPPLLGSGGRYAHAGSYARSAFGITPGGLPVIAWAATEEGRPQSVRAYSWPSARGAGAAWSVRSAVGCGPRLVQNGKLAVTDRQERLVSPGDEARTFVAYDAGTGGRPRHFLLGMASGMEYRDVARFVLRYFPSVDHTPAGNAMCVDGGASTQLSYRTAGGAVQSPRETGVSVPDAIVIVPR